MRNHLCIATLAVVALLAVPLLANGAPVIVYDDTGWTTAEQKAVDMLHDEILARTGLDCATIDHTAFVPSPSVTAFLVGRAGYHALIDSLRPGLSLPAEGFHLETLTSGGYPYVMCAGADNRGTLFAVGKCLRQMDYTGGVLTIPALNEEDSPEFPIRGHQLGYRTANNTIDAWDVPQFEQYFRDLIAFGANSIELIPPRTPGDPTGPLMPLSPWNMTLALCDLLNAYDLNAWMWVPAQVDLSNSTLRAQLLADRDALFAACSRIDAIFIPGGDPGSNSPSVLMPFIQDLATSLRTYHPQAQVWVSHQGWEIADRDWFYNYLQTIQPTWLTGVVFGPWTRDTITHTRAQVPVQYQIRRYPDITHCVRSQYPVPEWDHSFALTLGREPINPRPTAEAQICTVYDDYADGAITYSDGVNDDVNKIIWSARLWSASADVNTVLGDYNRYFFRGEFGTSPVSGILALESNWVGSVMTNSSIDTTLAAWQAMEAVASPTTLSDNWRFQQGLFRAYYDAYVRARRGEAAALEQEAYTDLALAPTVGANNAINNALTALARQDTSGVGDSLKTKVQEYGLKLFNSIGMQMSVPLYGASGSERGAVLDYLDEPLNSRLWLTDELNAILALGSESAKLAAITTILNWQSGGTCGFYDDLGNPNNEPHLVHAKTWAEDPGFVESAQDEFDWNKYLRGRLSWRRQGQTLYDTPLQLHYDNLDPAVSYTLRVTYAGRFNATMTLDADGTSIHGAFGATNPPTQYEYAIPPAVTADGQLTLTWQRVSGRGPQVAEVWLLHSAPIFADIPCTHWAERYIEAIYSAGLTAGCGGLPPLYCPAGIVTRGQMAIFLIRGMGETPCSTYNGYFIDVPESDPWWSWIERIRELGITAGCAGTIPGVDLQYCPSANVTRGQMAIFLIRAMGAAPSSTYQGYFTDVPESNPWWSWIERIYELAITSGCAGTPGNLQYCLSDNIRRDQMAVFLAKAFLGMNPSLSPADSSFGPEGLTQ